ncbi:hypothetical protein [Roseobacter sp. GAI101]|uniref:hypothetical protein n=1 Tax=Roseobacter sp. (strain GAI101) TaxID=391589 RepID=UPI00018718F5|nr:hypothetical protein [Roseobacter sp. GAI101]EEB85844.1 hypothetical protein RGAI101_2999 [Roseobacter sp. GAI101]
MVTTVEEVAALIDAYTELKAYFDGQKSRWDGELDVARASYGELLGDLNAVFPGKMFFSVTVDPTLQEYSNVNGGTFATIKEAVNASPVGSFVRIYLPYGTEHIINDNIYVWGRTLTFEGKNSGLVDRPIIRLGFSSSATHTYRCRFVEAFGCALKFNNIDIRPDAHDPTNPQLHTPSEALVSSGGPDIVSLGFRASILSGDGGFALLAGHYGAFPTLTIHASTLDGNVYGVRGFRAGVGNIGTSALTLTNGAALTDAA